MASIPIIQFGAGVVATGVSVRQWYVSGITDKFD